MSPKKVSVSSKTIKNGLNEKLIKCRLIDYLLETYHDPIIATEVPYLSGKRWVDVLLITDDRKLIAFEIKSDYDSLTKLNSQLTDYNKTFNEVYVVLSQKFLHNLELKKISKSVGIFYIGAGKKEFQITRRARTRKKLLKENLALFIWKNDLYKYGSKEEPVETLRKRFIRAESLEELNQRAVDALLTRYGKRFMLFLREKSHQTHTEDLDYLTKRYHGIL